MRFVVALLFCALAGGQTISRRPIVAATGCSLSYTTNLAAWYKADTGLTCTSGCTTGNAVTAWADQSGNSNNLTGSGSPTFQSAQVNSLPAVQFISASNQFFTLGTGINMSSAGSAAGSIFFVYKLLDTSNTGRTLLGDSGNGGLAYWAAKGGSKAQGADKSGVVQIAAGTASSDASWKQVNMIWVNGTSYAFRLNRAADGSGSSSDSLGTGVTENTIGKQSSGEYFWGQIAEVLIFNANIGTTNRDTVENYLNCRYGL
jgi:hypothetical protein